MKTKLFLRHLILKRFLILLLVGGLFSCDYRNSSIGSSSSSIGGFDEIVLVADQTNLDKYLRSPLLGAFKATFEVLPQDEPLFDARVINYEAFDNVFTRFRTVVFIADLGDNTSLTEFVIGEIGEDNTAKALNDSDFFFAVKKNIWANPQMVIFLFSPSKEQLVNRLSTGLQKVIEIAQASELEKYKNNAYFGKLNYEITNRLNQQAGIDLKIPEDYLLATSDANFFWLRKIMDEYDNHIMIDQRKLSEEPDAIEWRNKLGKEYISTKIEGSYMISDTILPFFTNEKIINNYRIKETRGLWKMVNDFMGGPFINYLIFDPDNDRVIMIDGFVYSPGEKNKPQVRTLEAIFSEFGKK